MFPQRSAKDYLVTLGDPSTLRVENQKKEAFALLRIPISTTLGITSLSLAFHSLNAPLGITSLRSVFPQRSAKDYLTTFGVPSTLRQGLPRYTR